MRATSFDQEAALAQGINVGRIFGLVWFIAGILAAFAGFFITGGFNTLSQTSFVVALRALPAVVIGGLDSIPGGSCWFNYYWVNTGLCSLLSI